MKARVLIVDPFRNAAAPLVPLVVIEEEGTVLLLGDYWARPVDAKTLQGVTLAAIRRALPISPDPSLPAALSEPTECPYPDLMSPEALQWRRSLWERAAQSLREREISKAS